ncbi:GntR family transcriptional regulator [Actinomadura rugatobispora]|uniref:GntR family transcriptional regulator n=1 Tax=Actinomadura rugatobispora TaxID=1994 RepID=A0ABW1A8Z5_9ACTN|nr:GntR family transcriptional regulator [Actinomadura rugatobispora]
MPDLPLERIDPDSDRAAFRQIADHLRTLIQRGTLQPGDRVPSEARLMEHYGVARMTVRQALQVLRSEGLVVAEHGRGVFVRERPRVRRLASDRFARGHRARGKATFIAEVEESGSKPTVDTVEVTEEEADADVAERLGLQAGARVIVRRRRYLIDGRPAETAVSYLPAQIAAGTAIARPDSGPGGIYARLEELGHHLARFTEEVRSRMPLQEEARALRLPAGVPVFHLIRTAYDTTGRPVEVCDTVMSSDAHVLQYELPAQ